MYGDWILKRKWLTSESTIGELYIDGVFECFVLEDPYDDGANTPGCTAIPCGKYRLVITFSNRFQKELPLVQGVVGRSGIRIHPGNTSADTEGCLLPGKTRAKDSVYRSREAFDAVFEKLKIGVADNQVWLNISLCNST